MEIITMTWRGGAPRFLGRWLAGEPVGSSSFTKLPKVPPLGEAKDARDRLDILTAGKGLGAKPRLLFDAWAEARGALNNFALADRRLTEAGFTHDALRDALWREAGKDTIATLRETAGVAFDAHDFIEKARAKLAAESFEPEQTEAERAAFDVALATKYASLPHAERLAWCYRGDPRILAALTRAPRAISEIADAELDEMRERHIATHFPHSLETFEALEKCIDPPRRTVAEGLQIVGSACGWKPAELVEGWGAAGQWIVGDGA